MYCLKRLLTGLVLTVGLAASTPAHADLVQAGEIVVLEGDATTVGGTAGAYGIDSGNIDAILNQFYATYPDEFDMVSIWTSFPDTLNGGAYFTSPPGVPGVQRLQGFINMNAVGFWQGFDALSTMGQEFGHRWLVFGLPDVLVGRDGSHWSSLADLEGSVMDGVDWVDNGDGTFTVAAIMNKYAPIDLWFMGYAANDEVPPFFVLQDAVTTEGTPLTPTAIWEGLGQGATALATRIDQNIDQIIAFSGPQPPLDQRQTDFRVAFVLVTEPGQTAAQVSDLVEQMDVIRVGDGMLNPGWNDTYELWTWHRGSMCTDTTADCPLPKARFVGGRVIEGAKSDGDGIVEPGEHADVEVDWRNTGNVATVGAIASLSAADIGAPDEVVIPTIQPNEVQTTVFDVTIPEGLTCAEEHVFTAKATVENRMFEGEIRMTPGVMEGSIESFATSADWFPNVDGTDTAMMQGTWDYGPAQPTANMGYTLQPIGGHGGPSDSAWWTGREAGFDWLANDVDLGVTRLYSTAYETAGLKEPQLRYYLWYIALNFNTVPPSQTLGGDELIVEASSNDGASWTEIDRVTGEVRLWERREVPLGSVAGGPVKFRFSVSDGGTEQNLVEVGIDDIQIISLSPSCGGGCGCRVGGADDQTPLGGVAALALVGLVSMIRRRRHI